MEALEAIRGRRSIGRLTEPAPSPDELRSIIEAATCAPDHGELRPWRFTVLEGEPKDAFGFVLEASYLARCAETERHAEPAKQDKERSKLGRAPVVVVVVCAYQPSDKIPRLEQYAAVAAATQNASLAATALGYATMWRTGAPAEDPRVKAALGVAVDDEIVGFLYLGSIPDGKDKAPHEPALDGVLSHWTPR